MSEILIIIVESDSAYAEKLNKRLYDEVERTYYYLDMQEMMGGFQRAIHLFNGIGNEAYLKIILRSYESLERTAIYSGKVVSIKRYYIQSNYGTEGRLKILADNKQLYDIPLSALADLGLA
jgi:hypothetical protein